MLTLIEVTNPQSQTLSLPMANDGTGYVVLDVSGLDPVKADIATSKYANFDGVQFQSASRGERNIVIRLGYEPDYEVESIQSMRAALYAYFLPKSVVNLKFTIGRVGIHDIIYEINGVVETMDAPIFAKDPEVNISIICTLPDLLDTTTLLFEGVSTAGFSEVSLDYTGTVDAGLVFSIFPDREIESFSLNVRRPDGVLQTLLYNGLLEEDDLLVISTGAGVKSSTKTHASVASNTLAAIPTTSVWMQLKPGTNLIRVALTGAAVPFTIAYKQAYGGL